MSPSASLCPIFVLFISLPNLKQTETVTTVVIKSPNHLCVLVGNAQLIIQCHSAEAGLFGIIKQGAVRNYLRQDVITSVAFSLKSTGRHEKLHYASYPLFPSDSLLCFFLKLFRY